MKFNVLPLALVLLITSCYTNNADRSDELLFRGTNAYYNSNNEYMIRVIFEEVANREECVSPAQKAYANVYLAKLKLRKGDVDSAICFLDKAEKTCKDFPYKYELMREYYASHNNNVKIYDDLLAKWINQRIKAIDNKTFDVNKLEFINSRSYINGKSEREFFPMYDLKKPKEFRAQLYKKYLNDKLLEMR